MTSQNYIPLFVLFYHVLFKTLLTCLNRQISLTDKPLCNVVFMSDYCKLKTDVYVGIQQSVLIYLKGFIFDYG